MFVYVTDCGTDDYFRSYKQILKASVAVAQPQTKDAKKIW